MIQNKNILISLLKFIIFAWYTKSKKLNIPRSYFYVQKWRPYQPLWIWRLKHSVPFSGYPQVSYRRILENFKNFLYESNQYEKSPFRKISFHEFVNLVKTRNSELKWNVNNLNSKILPYETVGVAWKWHTVQWFRVVRTKRDISSAILW